MPPAEVRRASVAHVIAVASVVSWFLVPAVLAWQAVGSSLTFLGESPSAAERATAERFWIASAVTAAVLPVIGLVGAAIARHRTGIVFSVILLLVGGAFAAWVGWGVHVAHRNDPQPPRPAACQEHSGGDTRCPGG